MNTRQNSTTVKVAAGFVGVVAGFFLLGLTTVATPAVAHAQTAEELQAQIQSLLATIAALQAQLGNVSGGTTTTPVACSFSFLRDLGPGSTGADVMNLQQFLNMSADTRVAATGAGSPGQETSYYGPATAAAVSRFQVKYAASILTPLGLTSGTGYFGASSRAQARQICSTTGNTGNNGGNTGSDNGDLSGGEADISDMEILSNPHNEDVDLGSEDNQVLGFKFDVDDADASVQRVDVTFTQTVNGEEKDPWDAFDEVSLWNGDKKIADVDASDEDNWDETSTDDEYTIRFDDVDTKIDAGDTAEMYVAVSVNDDSDLEGSDWKVFIGDRGLRAVDGMGLQTYLGHDDTSSDYYETFSFDAEETGSLEVSENSDNPDAGILIVDEDMDSDEYDVLDFDIENNDDQDVTIHDLTFNGTTTPITGEAANQSFTSVVKKVTLEIDGDTYTGDIDEGADNEGATISFDDIDVDVDADDTLEGRLMVVFNDTDDGANYAVGTKVAFTLGDGDDVDEDDIDAESDVDDLADADLTGHAESETQTLLTFALDPELGDTSFDGNANDGSVGTYSISFDLTAHGEDLYIPMNASTTDASSTGVVYSIEGSTFAGTKSAILDSDDADEDGSYFRVDDGETATFTLTVSLDASSTGLYGIQMEKIYFDDDKTGGSDYDLDDLDDFDVTPRTLSAS
jgi:peptidoglycan hydrolase-like protein with peptidoglycan-binding domain